MKLFRLLMPSALEIERLAVRETDPARCHEFEPITRGPVLAVALLVGVAIAALAVSPVRLVMRIIRRERS